MADRVPNAPSWWLAVTLRQLREEAAVSRERAASAIGKGVAYIGHFERADRIPSELQLDGLLTLYGAPERLPDLLALRGQAKLEGDWPTGLDKLVRPTFPRLVELELRSPAIEGFSAIVVPGNLQTRQYATAIIRAGNPKLNPADIQRLVDLRMRRGHGTVHRIDRPRIRIVIAEAALRLEVGGIATLREQLEYLLVVPANVELQVLRASAGAHAATEGTFAIVSAPPEIRSPGCVFVEDYAQDYYYDNPATVAAYRDALDRLRRPALAPDESRAFISGLLEDL